VRNCRICNGTIRLQESARAFLRKPFDGQRVDSLCRSDFPKHQRILRRKERADSITRFWRDRASSFRRERRRFHQKSDALKGSSCMRHWELHRTRQASNRGCMICLLLALALGAAANAACAQTTLGRADFVRQTQRIDGFWFPYRDETSVEVKMYGRRAFTVDHQQYVINADSSLKGSSGDTGENVLVAPSAALRP
jgi:hypothetical protein